MLGMGFVLQSEEALTLIDKDPRNRDVLFPFLTGEDLNSRPDQSPSRWVINFFDWSEVRAKSYSDCWAIIEAKVKPERQRKKETGDYALRKPLPQRYWQYADKRPALYASIMGMDRAIVIALTSRTLAFDFLPKGTVASHATVVLALDSTSAFGLLQSNIHTEWARKYGSSMKKDARYTPSDCFENFPFPLDLSGLENIGERYYAHRQEIMQERQEGLTKTYNRSHNPDESAEDIERLRELHVEMDRAVANAYGWDDLDLGHGFHETKQGMRFTISEEARREVLDRLLLLNHKRYAEEVEQGLHDKKKKKRKTKKRPKPRADGGTDSLFSSGDEA